MINESTQKLLGNASVLAPMIEYLNENKEMFHLTKNNLLILLNIDKIRKMYEDGAGSEEIIRELGMNMLNPTSFYRTFKVTVGAPISDVFHRPSLRVDLAKNELSRAGYVVLTREELEELQSKAQNEGKNE